MTLNTYLTFDGNCREAFDFYRSDGRGRVDRGSGPVQGVKSTETDLRRHL